MDENYIGKTISDYVHGFKTKSNNHITESSSGVHQSANGPFVFLIAVKELTDN